MGFFLAQWLWMELDFPASLAPKGISLQSNLLMNSDPAVTNDATLHSQENSRTHGEKKARSNTSNWERWVDSYI